MAEPESVYNSHCSSDWPGTLSATQPIKRLPNDHETLVACLLAFSGIIYLIMKMIIVSCLGTAHGVMSLVMAQCPQNGCWNSLRGTAPACLSLVNLEYDPPLQSF